MNNEKLCVDNRSVVLYFFCLFFVLLVNEYQNISVVLGDNCYNVGNSAAQGRVLFIHLHSVYSHMCFLFCLYFCFLLLTFGLFACFQRDLSIVLLKYTILMAVVLFCLLSCYCL